MEAKISYSDNEKIYLKQEFLTETGNQEKKFQIKFNNFQINFYKTLSKFKIYDTIYTEQNLKIFSNFYLPISVGKIINKEQVKEEKNYSIDEAKNLGVESLSKKIESLIENKENICNKIVDYKEHEEYVEVFMIYEVLENIVTYEKIED